MKQELQKELYDKYPELFSNKDKSIMESYVAFGVYHYSNGNYPKVRRLLCLEEIVQNAMLT